MRARPDNSSPVVGAKPAPVRGEVWLVGPRAARQLDMLEGHPKHYRRRPVKVLAEVSDGPDDSNRNSKANASTDSRTNLSETKRVSKDSKVAGGGKAKVEKPSSAKKADTSPPPAPPLSSRFELEVEMYVLEKVATISSVALSLRKRSSVDLATLVSSPEAGAEGNPKSAGGSASTSANSSGEFEDDIEVVSPPGDWRTHRALSFGAS